MKRALKKTMSLVIAFAMVCSMALFVNAAGTPTLTMGSGDAAVCEDVTVAINLANNPGFITMTLQIDYDSSVMSLTNVAEKSLISGALHQDDLGADPYQLLWENDDLLTNITTESGVLAELTFTIKEDAAPGEYPVKILCANDNPIQPNIYDYDYEPVDFTAVDGVITVKGGEPAPSEPTVPTLTIGSGKAEAGKTVTVPINLFKNPGFITMTLQIDYDSSVMSLTNVAEKSLISGALHQDDLGADPYQLLWENDDLLTNITTESGVLAELTFTIKEDAAPGEYPVKILCANDNPIQPNIYDYDYEPVDFTAVDGTITVEGEVPPAGPDYDVTALVYENGTLTLQAAEALENVYVLVVSYDNDGKTFVDAVISDPIAIGADEDTTIDFAALKTGTTYKAMLWADLENCEPLADAIDWQ